MATIRTNNNPAMLVWAREEIGYSLEQAAAALRVSVDTLNAAESGKKFLTLNQLRHAAKMYDCPYGYFYLSKPPHKKSFKPIPDFRVEPDYIGVSDYRLNLEIKKSRDRRAVFLDLAADLEIEVKPFKLLRSSKDKNIGGGIRERLGITDSDILSLPLDKVYSYWKSKLENDGVLVYESQYIPDVTGVIGAAIFYETSPIILIKRGEKSNPWKLFTLLHEYAHLLKGKSAVNDKSAQIVEDQSQGDVGIEQVCNQLAAEILVPSEKVNISEYKNLDLIEKMDHLSTTFKVTKTTAAVCLKRLKLISDSDLLHLFDLRHKAHLKAASIKGKNKSIAIPRENIMRLDMGRPFFNAVLSAYDRGVLDVFDASKILNLRVHKLDKLVGGL
jgi:Zn-dependent peptidase ImmA (M78 family)/DNA-binding XRE family transcriptional regulator